MQQLSFIDKPITQNVSGTIVPIFRSAKLYTTAYGFQHHCAHLQECKAVHYCIWFSAPLCPSSGLQGCTLMHMVFSTIVPIFRSARLYTTAHGFQHHCAYLQECKVVHYCTWFSAPLCPSSGVQGCTLLHMVFST